MKRMRLIFYILLATTFLAVVLKTVIKPLYFSMFHFNLRLIDIVVFILALFAFISIGFIAKTRLKIRSIMLHGLIFISFSIIGLGFYKVLYQSPKTLISGYIESIDSFKSNTGNLPSQDYRKTFQQVLDFSYVPIEKDTYKIYLDITPTLYWVYSSDEKDWEFIII